MSSHALATASDDHRPAGQQQGEGAPTAAPSRRLRRILTAFDRAVTAFERGLLVILLVMAVGVLMADILSRIVFGQSISWAAELTRYAIVWMVFIGGGVGARHGAHISIDVLSEILPPRIGTRILQASSIIAAIACAIFAWHGTRLVLYMARFSQKSPALEIPMWWVYCALPLGFALMTIRFLQNAATLSKDQRRLDLATSTA